jgi:short-subunit dehydrogenase
MPGTYQAVYNATKAFLDSFSFALRHELKDSGVTVTCLMPGATETEFFERADMMDTKIGQEKKDDPARVARQGFDAMMRGEGDVVTGWQNKLQIGDRVRPAIRHGGRAASQDGPSWARVGSNNSGMGHQPILRRDVVPARMSTAS